MTYLEFIRRSRNETQKQFGEQPAVGIHAHFISMIERGIGLPTPAQLDRLAKACGLPPEKVLQHVELPILAVEKEETTVRG